MTHREAQVNTFLTEKLGLDLESLRTDRHQFLCDLVKAFDQQVPFQNLSSTTVPLSERVPLTVEESLECVLRLEGGRCWSLNAAMHEILAGLGYTVEALVGTVGGTLLAAGRPQHTMVLVRGLKRPGDSYLVDMGMSCTAHPPISMDFPGEVSPTYQVGCQKVRWLRQEDGTFLRQNEFVEKNGKVFNGKIDDGFWEDCCLFRLNPMPLDEVREIVSENFYQERTGYLNMNRRMCRTHPELGKFVLVFNDKFLIETQGPVLNKTCMDSMEEILETIAKYFPYIPQSVARASYEEWYRADRLG